MKTRSKGSYVAEILKALIFAVIISLVLGGILGKVV